MLYVLDTNVVREVFDAQGSPVVKGWFASLHPSATAIPQFVYLEIYFGIEKIREDNPAKFARLDQAICDIEREFGVLEATPEVTRVLARMLLCRPLKPLWQPDPSAKKIRCCSDVHIAATAIGHHAVVATRNTDDFSLINRHFPLPGLLDPWTGTWHVPTADLRSK